MIKRFAFDTSALISLGHTKAINEINNLFLITTSSGVIAELKNISKADDADGNAAKEWLKKSKSWEIINVKREKHAEDEVFSICKKKNLLLVTDDIKAIKRFDDEIDCFYSVHIIYSLYKKEVITKELALVSIEKMRQDRSWGNNIIYVTSQSLFGE